MLWVHPSACSALTSATCPQIASGLGLGALFAYAGSLISRGEAPAGYQVACGTSVVTGAAMATRYQKTRKAVPAGLLAPVAFVSAAYYAFKASEPQ